MEIVFQKDYLKELFYEGKAKSKKYRFQPEVVKKYIQVINLMESLHCVEDFYRYKSLNYEHLIGDKEGTESVRVNKQYRIEFQSEAVKGEEVLTICNIFELSSNHYK